MIKIGELAKRTGLAASTIRYYEDIGLLTQVHRSANGYRMYPESASTVLSLIGKGQQAGFSLDELRAIMPQDPHLWHHDTLVTALKGKLKDIEQQEAQLASSKHQLNEILATIDNKPADMSCSDNAKRVIAQIKK